MLIIRFRGKYICLNNFKLGFAAYISIISVMYLLEWGRKRKKRGSISNRINNMLTLRGGDIFRRKFLRKKLKKGRQYEVVNPRLIRYIRQLTNSLDSKEILYIDLELLAYAIRTLNRPRASEVVMGGVVSIVNPVRTIGSIVIGSFARIIVKVITNTSSIIGSVVLIILLYTSPYRQYNDNLLSDLSVNNENIQYILKEPQAGKIIVSIDDSCPELKTYQMEGKTFTSKDSESIVVEHKPTKKKRKFNRRVWTLNDLKKDMTADDYNESEEDAAYVRRPTGREGMRIRINTKKRDSE